MTDSWGDGWDGYSNIPYVGLGDQQFTMPSSAQYIYSVDACVDLSGCVSVDWLAGSYDSECGFTISDASGDLFSVAVAPTTDDGVTVNLTTIGECVTGCSDENASNYDPDADIICLLYTSPSPRD